MNTKRSFFAKVALVLWVSCMASAVLAQSGGPQPKAKQILDATNVKGGLVVHLGCGDGKLTAALRAGDSYLVHGLETSEDMVRQARQHIQSLGIYGNVTINRFDGKYLPYADNLVNLIVAEELGEVTKDEVTRVLCPGGVALLRRAMSQRTDGGGEGIAVGGEIWSKIIKSWPKNIDEWTHYFHDPSGNAVAHDEVVGPPRYLQWTAEPPHTLSHEHTPSINALVSTCGRIFYIADQASMGFILRPPQWQLVARDAFNGILLWKRPIPTWYPHIVNWGQTPSQLQRRLVAVGDRVYVTMGLHAPLSALDAATGKTLEVYENTLGTEEILCHQGILLLIVRSVTDERIAERTKMEQLTLKKKSPLHERDSAQPLISRFRKIEASAEKTILALEADTGSLLWQKTGADAAGVRTLSFCADEDRVFYQKGRDVICVNLRSGREQWTTSSAPLRLVNKDSIICADGRMVTALSIQNGKARWKQDNLVTQIRDVFVANGSLWMGGFKPIKGKRGPSWGPYFATQRDLNTGKMLKHIEPENPGHHHRCYLNKATDRYIIGGRRGTEFIDLSTGDVLWNSWARGVCKYGVMPANGFLYAPPHACGCYMAAKLIGFNALSSGSNLSTADNPTLGQWERGPAYKQTDNQQSTVGNRNDWPTYRHDPRRSGYTRFPVPARLRQKWQRNIGGKLTSLTVADGKVFVASVEDHKISTLNADSGQSIWSFTAGARVDSPPTLYQGRAIFGCRDGYVYSLRASDGRLAWCLRAARDDRRIVASAQLESATPVHGSVLIQDQVACFTAGRSSYLDGGINLYRLQPNTGKILSKTPIYSPDPQTGKQPKQYGPNAMPGARMDILSSDDSHVYLRDMVFDKQGDVQTDGNPHLLTLTGFLDDSWAHRSYWIFGTRCSIATGCSGRDRNLIYGRMLVFNDSTIFGYGRKNVHWSNQLRDGDYRLFAIKQGEKTPQWNTSVNIQVRAMLLADKVLFIAGPSINTEKNQPARLLAFSAADGTRLAQYSLEDTPVFDGMAAAMGRLYLSLESGRVICMTGS